MAGNGATARVRRSSVAAVVVAGFAASVVLSIVVGRAGGQFASIWTANGFLAAGFILLPRRWSAPVAAICVLAQAAIGLAVGDGLLRALANPLVNLAEAALAAWLAVRFCGARARRLSLRELMLLPIGAIIPAAIVGGVLGAGVNAALLGRDPLYAWAEWAMPGGFGMVIVLPAMLLMTRVRQYPEFRRPLWEVGAISLGVAALTAALFVERGMSLQFLAYPALTFVAFRLGPPGAAIAGGLIGLVGLPLVMLGHGPVALPAAPNLADRARVAELGIAAMLFTTLATAGALSDQLRLRRMMLWRDQAARAARLRARRAERLAQDALSVAAE